MGGTARPIRYIDGDGQIVQDVDEEGGGGFATFPRAPFGGWQRLDRARPATARVTSRAPDLSVGVRLRPTSAVTSRRPNSSRPQSGSNSQQASARGAKPLGLDLQALYGVIETESRPSARKTERFVIDGEPTCRTGTEVKVAAGYEWDGLQPYRGHAGKLTRRVADKGWFVFFPSLKEEAFFYTSAKHSMLVYNASDVHDIPQAHIFANQLKYSDRRGQGPDAYTSLKFATKCGAQLSFRGEHSERSKQQ